MSDGYWWCSHCEEEVGAARVTFQERHDSCGRPVEWIEPEDGVDWRAQAEAAEKDRAREFFVEIGPRGGIVSTITRLSDGPIKAGTYAMRLVEPWQPTSENINALPEPVRKYVHDLETRCDPAGEVAALTLTRDQNAQLQERLTLLLEAVRVADAYHAAVGPCPGAVRAAEWDRLRSLEKAALGGRREGGEKPCASPA